MTVCYTTNNITPVNYRTRAFTLAGGTAEDETGTVPANPYPIPDALNTLMEKMGFRDAFVLIIMNVIALFRNLKTPMLNV